MPENCRVLGSALVFATAAIIIFLMVVYGYFGVIWRFIPDWPQALAILIPMVAGLMLNMRGLMNADKNKLRNSVEKWLVRFGVFFLFWAILMISSQAGGPKPQEYVYPLGPVIAGFGLATGIVLTAFSPLWTGKHGKSIPKPAGARVKARMLQRLFSKKVLFGLLLISWLLAAPLFEGRRRLPVNGLGLEINAPTRFAPHFLGRPANPMIGGYMTHDYKNGSYELSRASAVKLTASFNGTADHFPSTIQQGNYLGVGIAISGPDYKWGSGLSIDWSYSFVIFLNRSGGPYIQIEVWKAFEFFNFAENVVSVAYSDPQLGLHSFVTLTMEWDHLGYLNYYVAADGKSLYPSPLYRYYPDVRDSCSPYFYLTPPRVQGSVKYFQFVGAWSAHRIFQPGWVTNLDSPMFVKKQSVIWESVNYAYSLSGLVALLDSNIRWGGSRYKRVNIDRSFNNGETSLQFYPTTYRFSFKEGTLLWDSHTGS